MAKSKARPRARARPRVARRRSVDKTAPHSILATIFGASAAAVPLITPQGGGWTAAALVESGEYASAGQVFVESVESNWQEILGLAIGAAIVGYAGKKYAKSATNVSKKWRIV